MNDKNKRVRNDFKKSVTCHPCKILGSTRIYQMKQAMNLAVMNVIYALGANVSGFIAQLVRASHRYHKVKGLNPVEVLICSGLYIRSWINCVHNCKDHSLLDFTSAILYIKHFIYHFTLSNELLGKSLAVSMNVKYSPFNTWS